LKTVVIIQARYSSTRLPGKVLMPINKVPLLAHVIDRCKLIENADEVCCAIPIGYENDPLVEIAKEKGIKHFRGAELDVLSRYYHAAKKFYADNILRVTSDCPLIQPDICDKVIQNLYSIKNGISANNFSKTYPHGLDCEAFSFDVLERAYIHSTSSYDREHVTPWIRKNKEIPKVNLSSENTKLANLRLTIDFKEDLEFVNELFIRVGSNSSLSLEKVEDILKREPELSKINQMHNEKSRPIEQIL